MSDKLVTSAGHAPAQSEEAVATLADQPSTTKPQYFCTITNGGMALEAAAHAAKKPVRLFAVAVGDGNGLVPTPAPTAEKLVHEVYRREISSITTDENDPNICWISMIIPANDGGFWIREFGVYAESLETGGAPVLFAYGNHAPYYKLKTILGQAITHEISIPLIMSSAAEVEIVVSETGYASRRELLYLADIVQSLREPKEVVWTLNEELPENGVLQLPSGFSYLPGHHQVELAWDGLVCYPTQQFRERADGKSLEMLFPVPAGSRFFVRINGASDKEPLPHGFSPQGIEAKLGELAANLAEVQDEVAYIK